MTQVVIPTLPTLLPSGCYDPEQTLEWLDKCTNLGITPASMVGQLNRSLPPNHRITLDRIWWFLGDGKRFMRRAAQNQRYARIAREEKGQ